MKNLKNIIIGLFTVIGVMVLLMGNNNVQKENGRYQISVTDDGVMQYIYLLDTRTGEVWSKKSNVWAEEMHL
tara:strand:+ start:568 stop:783 length:216 start_codon:yes stop_codon:yes gene_type:complete